jgi:hypothetical protein
MLAGILDQFISNSIDRLSMSDAVKETSYKPDSVENFVVFKDNSFTPLNI